MVGWIPNVQTSTINDRILSKMHFLFVRKKLDSLWNFVPLYFFLHCTFYYLFFINLWKLLCKLQTYNAPLVIWSRRKHKFLKMDYNLSLVYSLTYQTHICDFVNFSWDIFTQQFQWNISIKFFNCSACPQFLAMGMYCKMWTISQWFAAHGTPS